MTAYDHNRSGELSDDDLDALLAAAHSDLLRYVEGHADASAGLLALMSESPSAAAKDAPPAANVEGAAAVIGLRSLPRNHDCGYLPWRGSSPAPSISITMVISPVISSESATSSSTSMLFATLTTRATWTLPATSITPVISTLI
jgi:hypothetical protein